MIPIRDINPTTRTAWLTLAIIAANVAVFLLWEPTFADQGTQQTFLFCNAEIPYEVTHQTTLADGGTEAVRAIEDTFDAGAPTASALQDLLRERCPDKSWLASIFVSMFLHGGFLHIAGNMLFLWIFGNNVEDRLGRIRFILLYVLGGSAASGLQLAFDPNAAVPNVGASGAIAAILGAYLILFPRARIHTLLIFFFITTGRTWAASSSGWGRRGSSSDRRCDGIRTFRPSRRLLIGTDRPSLYATTARR